MLKTVVHINFDDDQRQADGLRNVGNMLDDAAKGADIRVVCHGPGLSLLVRKDHDNAQTIAELMDRGIQFLACENTLKSKKLTTADLVAGAGSVSSGAAEIVRLQQDGFAYFRP